MAMSSILNTDDIKKALDAFAGEYQHSRDGKKLVPKKAGARTFGGVFLLRRSISVPLNL